MEDEQRQQEELREYEVEGEIRFRIRRKVRARSSFEALGKAAGFINDYNIHTGHLSFSMNDGGNIKVEDPNPNIEWLMAVIDEESEDGDE